MHRYRSRIDDAVVDHMAHQSYNPRETGQDEHTIAFSAPGERYVEDVASIINANS